MDLTKLVKENKHTMKKYEFYRSLGYGEKASELLSLLTYGNFPLQQLIKSLPKEHIMDALYAWFLERPETAPENAVSAFHRENTPEPQISGAAPGGSGGGFLNKLFAPRSKGRSRTLEGASAGRGLARGMEDNGVEMLCDEPVETLYAAAPPETMMMAAASAPMDRLIGATVAPSGPAFGAAMSMKAPETASLKELSELTSTDSYEQIEEKGFRAVLTEPTSTFRMTTNTSSMGIVLNQIREGRHVDLSQVRIEELLNYFTYDEEPAKDEKFRIHTELCGKNDERDLLYIYAGARGEEKEKQNIVILLDVSGSMSSQKEVTQETLAAIVSRLKPGNRLSLITYSSNDETVYDGFVINGEGDREDVMGRILGIVISGCTNGSAGIETAYTCGAKYYDKEGNNQVILITDGDLNFGVTAKDGLKKLIEEKKKSGLFLSVIGTGLYNYKDDKLEVLSKHGNGTYCVVNKLEDVKESVVRRYVSLTSIVAKDVKAQVEFNPRFVKEYRLLGYENRALSHADFKDDTVISEPYGSGGYGVALYELIRGNSAEGEAPLKYQTAVLSDSEELCTVKLRYKEPLSDESTELSHAVTQEKNGGDNTRLARLLYCIGEKLRASDKLDDADEEFFRSMLDDDAWEKLPGNNGDKLKLLLDYIKRNS
ncbi:MAG: von Willebrand factor type A domain-containing protein [Lachnospiraceae bacterium]|nr:von Willebrand factor type A domain-containing protein [Lachnospiraceae bacterium]